MKSYPFFVCCLIEHGEVTFSRQHYLHYRQALHGEILSKHTTPELASRAMRKAYLKWAKENHYVR